MKRITRVFTIAGIIFLNFATPSSAAVVPITDTQVSSPIVLGQVNTTYVLQNNLTCTGSCFVVTANDVILDLNSYVVTFGTDAGQYRYGVAIPPGYIPNPYVYSDVPSTAFRGADRTVIKNGSLIQGAAGTDNAVIFAHEGARLAEVGNIHGYYQGTDSNGVISLAGGNINIHDNTIEANLSVITNRHRAKTAIAVVNVLNGYVYVRNNTVFGNGQFGINVTSRKTFGSLVTDAEVSGNTMRINGITTNPYQLIIHGFSRQSQGITLRVFNNRIEAPGNVSNRGMLFEGIDSSADGIDGALIHDNYVEVKEHGNQEYGEVGWTHGLRMRDPDYVIPNTKFFNNEIYNNTIKVIAYYNSATDNGHAYGVRLTFRSPLPTGTNPNIFHDNTIIAETLDSRMRAYAVQFEGHHAQAGTIFRNNNIISNSKFVMFGWQGGDNTLFESNTFTLGANPINPGFFYFSNSGPAVDNVFLDSHLIGIDYLTNLYQWRNPQEEGPRNFWVKWYLDLTVNDSQGQPISDAQITIFDKNNNQVFNGITDMEGKTRATLTDYFYNVSTLTKTDYNPYTVAVSKTGVNSEAVVVMDASKQVAVILDSESPHKLPPPPNQAPVLNPIGNKSIDENQLLSFAISTTDADSDPLILSAINLPLGSNFTDNGDGTGELIWTPDYSQAGVHQVRFVASDGRASDEETIDITVNNVNTAPVLASIGEKTVAENSNLDFGVSASDADGDSLTYTVSQLPSGATFSNKTFHWTPGYDQAGIYMVVFTVSDGTATDSESVIINITNVNRAPQLPDIGNKTIKEGEMLAFTLLATDPDGGNLSYAASGLPAGANLTNGVFSWTPDYSQAGSYPVVFSVSDGALSDSEQIAITVNNVNRAPVLSAVGDKTINKGSLLAFDLSASDPDNDTLTYTALNLPSGANLAGKSFSWTPNNTQSGTYQVTFKVSDGSLSDAKTMLINVLDANRPPVLKPIGNKTINEGQSLNFAISATDPDGDKLTYTALNLPVGATFGMGDIAANSFRWVPEYNQAGSYKITFKVTDGKLTGEETITIAVSNVNRPPVLQPIGNKTIDEGQSLKLAVSATDPDGDQLTYSALPLPRGATFVNQIFSWTPDYTQSGRYRVIFRVTDGGLSNAQETIVITVKNVARPSGPGVLSGTSVTANSFLRSEIMRSKVKTNAGILKR